MKIQDNARWLGQQSEIAASLNAEVGKIFVDFLVDWCETAEAAMDYGRMAPVEALRAALEPTETRRGNISGTWMVQMLVVAIANWGYGGDELFESLTEFEKRLVAEMTAIIIAAMQESAQEVADAQV